MGIPDGRPSNYWGFWFVDQVFNSTYGFRDWDGSWIQRPDTNRMTRHVGSLRLQPSNNPIIPLVVDGAKCWRNPSSYERSLSRFESIQRGSYSVTSGSIKYQEITEDFWFDQMAQHMKSRPEFWRYGPYNPTIGMSVNKRARLITECLLKIKGQKMSLGASLAEAKQTYTMFAKHAGTFFKSITAARRGNWKEAFRTIGISRNIRNRPSASGVYLEYTYGIAPLLGEIYGGWELLNEQLKPVSLVHAVRKLGKSVQDSYIRADVGASREWTISEQFRGVDKLSLTGKISDQYARDCARAGLLNPASIAWEVVPWSFLIDWGMPIGNCLEAMDATAGLDFIGGYFSSTGSGTMSCSSKIKDYSNPNQWRTDTPAAGAVFLFSNVREKLTGWPWPQPYVKSPFSSTHAANALALFRQLNRRY